MVPDQLWPGALAARRQRPSRGRQIYEDWGGGSGKLYGTIGWCDPPAGYSQTSHVLGEGITLTHRYQFAEEGDGTVLRHEFSAFGPISEDMAAGIEGHASLETFESQLLAWIERGETIPPPEL